VGNGNTEEKISGGCLPDPQDDRDYPFEAFVGGDDFPEEYDVEDKFGALKVKNQGATLACGSYATAYYAEMLEQIENKTYLEFSPRWFYGWTHLSGGASYTRDNVMRLVNFGAAPESIFSTTPVTEEHLESQTGVSPLVEKIASKYKGKIATVITDTSNFELITQAIHQGHGVVSGISDHCLYMKSYGKDYIKAVESLGMPTRTISRTDVEAGKLHSCWTVIDLPNNWEEINNNYKLMVNAGNANGILFALDGKTTHTDSQLLADALNSGNQAKVNEIISKYVPTNKNILQQIVNYINSLIK